jgi:hypothetical protein
MHINLPNSGLKGKIPACIGQLTELTVCCSISFFFFTPSSWRHRSDAAVDWPFLLAIAQNLFGCAKLSL